jgi:SAM-dependent methyltransferase
VTEDYLQTNRANWDSRAPIHEQGYGVERYLSEPDAISDVVAFDLPRLGRLDGLDVVHLQCHIGTDTLSLARLGAASVTGVDFSPVSLASARRLAERTHTAIDYVESDLYSAPSALAGRQFDLVYTGVGAICWLPSIARWAQVVAALLRPGGRLFIRDGHPVLNAMIPQQVGAESPDRAQQPWITGTGGVTVALELPYFEQTEPIAWTQDFTYSGEGEVASPVSVEWNHGIGEIVTAVLDAGLRLTGLVEHDSGPWEAFDGMVLDPTTREYRLADRPERLPASFTLTASKP